MSGPTRLLALIVGLFVAVGLLTPTAQASGYNDPNILSPQWGDEVRIGYTGPATIDFSDAPAGSYNVSLTDPVGNTAWDTDLTTDDSTTTVPVKLGNITQAGDWELDVNYTGGDYSSSASQGFTVLEPTTMGGLTLSPSTFYPRVRDGYKDDTTLTYDLYDPSASARVSARVTNSRGTTVRSAAWNYGSDVGEWTWRGRNNSGALVGTGTYKITLTAKDSTGRTLTHSRSVTVATGYRTQTFTKTRNGYQRSSSSHSGACSANRDYYSGETELDCWGSGAAQANYNFSTPRNAYGLSWWTRGYEGCCDQGHITKWVTRPNSTAYDVHVKATVWRNWTITKVGITYRTRNRI